ncbi:MAG: hypothetical protein EZS28_011324 [Streblomastix strix]|uniref:Uncharacterized protein n=1 Tax=Streblomastix strix TaxID=222440 RepID=A0A5J4WDY5_9EUKA|nr:MAG: hypothetical protein EZS28_011324 [Streblomastix strix]
MKHLILIKQKKVLAKFGLLVEIGVTIYGWKIVIDGEIFLAIHRWLDVDQQLHFIFYDIDHVGIYTVAYVETFPAKAIAYNPCSKDEHSVSCQCPINLTDIPKENCPCPVTVDEHVKDPRKDGICRCPQKGTDEFKTDPRTKVNGVCYAGVARTALLMVMMTLIMPILVQYLF